MKTSNAISVDYEGLEVKFTDDAWFNATSAADKFGRRPIDWIRLDETQNYMDALAKALEIQIPQELKGGLNSPFIKTTKGRNGGTWLHPKLAVAFARWLDVDFSVWCDIQIDGLIRGTHPSSNPPRNALRQEKRDSHHVMMDVKKYVLEEILGEETSHGDFIKENLFCNRALTGKWEAIDDASLDNYDLRLLKAIRNHNAVLIAHYPKQKEAAANGKSRYELMEKFVAEYRIKHPRLSLVGGTSK